jgi:hypothetical protein
MCRFLNGALKRLRLICVDLALMQNQQGWEINWPWIRMTLMKARHVTDAQKCGL